MENKTIKPKPNDYVIINNKEEYDTAIKAFVKAGGVIPTFHWLNYNKEEPVILLTNNSNWIVSTNMEDIYACNKKTTIKNLREYLNNRECVYKVGDVVMFSDNLFTIQKINTETETLHGYGNGKHHVCRFNSPSAHYKLAVQSHKTCYLKQAWDSWDGESITILGITGEDVHAELNRRGHGEYCAV